MTVLQAILLGLIQGLSEFIPISSTAHLTLAGHLLGVIEGTAPEAWTSFMATIQLGTLLAVFVYFARDVRDIPLAFIKENFTSKRKKISEQSLSSRMGWLICAGSIPIATIGLALKKVIEGDFTKSPTVIGCSLIALALIMAFAERVGKFSRDGEKLGFKDAIFIGLAQCLALIPGASRSGTTITAGMFMGLTREAAARFSFLLSIPAILASGLLEFFQSLSYIDASQLVNLIVATVISAISGYISIAFLLKFLKTRTTYSFAIYRIIIGIAVLLYL